MSLQWRLRLAGGRGEVEAETERRLVRAGVDFDFDFDFAEDRIRLGRLEEGNEMGLNVWAFSLGLGCPAGL